MTDPISDMLTRIRNAQAVYKETVDVPFSRFKFDLAEVLVKNGYLANVVKNGKDTKRVMILTLKYKDSKPFIRHIKRISKPGQKIYIKRSEIQPVLRGYGMHIISTPQGLMTDKEARKNGVGGEVVCEIW